MIDHAITQEKNKFKITFNIIYNLSTFYTVSHNSDPISCYVASIMGYPIPSPVLRTFCPSRALITEDLPLEVRPNITTFTRSRDRISL